MAIGTLPMQRRERTRRSSPSIPNVVLPTIVKNSRVDQWTNDMPILSPMLVSHC